MCQACVFYGAAQVSKDLDVMLLAEAGNFARLQRALAKKTQRSKDWPVIELLVAIHYRENGGSPRPEWVEFWLREARAPELLVELARRFSAEVGALTEVRPLLQHAVAGDLAALRPALDAEVRAEQDQDRAYWEPLKQELESLRLAEAREQDGPRTG